MRRKPTRGLVRALLTIMLAAAFLLPLSTTAQAVTVPEWGLSWYFTGTASDAYNKGCTVGTEAANTAGTQNYVVVLDMGAMFNTSSGWKFDQWSLSAITDDAAKTRIQQYGLGFYVCSAADTTSYLRVALGTHNQSGDVTYAAGKAMALRVKEANTYLASQGVASQVGAFGANDIELGYGGPATARDWHDGYEDAGSSVYYYTGDAAGCSSSQQAGTECGTPSFPGWDANDVWYVSNSGLGMPLPQIYREDGIMAKQWKYLSLYAYNVKGARMTIRGSATQHASCGQPGHSCPGLNNTVSDGYNQLYDELNSNSHTAQAASTLLATDWKWTNP
jgi:hypothetical protein